MGLWLMWIVGKEQPANVAQTHRASAMPCKRCLLREEKMRERATDGTDGDRTKNTPYSTPYWKEGSVIPGNGEANTQAAVAGANKSDGSVYSRPFGPPSPCIFYKFIAYWPVMHSSSMSTWQIPGAVRRRSTASYVSSFMNGHPS